MAGPLPPEVKELFGEALEQPADARAAFLAERCAGSPSRRAQVEALLAAHAHAATWLGVERTVPCLPGVGGVLAATAGELRPGDTLGPYRVCGTAGAGSFGTVYTAEQSEPVSRRVALKVMHRGLDSSAARARFEAEQQALARMEHPAIARVYDAGTTPDGRPFFVMEFVDGLPITEHCQRRALDTAARLQIFRAVCLAVQHAHQKGVVHRDLKPSNVLVTEVDGQALPKVIDFGVAKAIDGPLTDLALVSLDGQLIGTPAYMSPEQAAGEVDVDTRSDVYGLGALLYELLAGSPPFDVRELGFAGLLDAISHVEPQLPGRRALAAPAGRVPQRVPEDLDWITMRCLEKERSRRYPSAGALALDLERFLDGRPVEAAPPSTWYRLRKLTSRHRLAVAAAAALVLVFAAGSIGTLLGLVRAERANAGLAAALHRAAREAERAQQAERSAASEAEFARRQAAIAAVVNDFLLQDLLGAALPSHEDGRGRDVPLRVVVDAASTQIEGAGQPGGRFADLPEVESALCFMLGSIHAKLGEAEPALRHLRRAAELDRRLLGPEHANSLRSGSALGNELRRQGDLAAAESLLVPALAAQRRQLGEAAAPTLLTQYYLGLLRWRQGRSEEALALLRDGLALAAGALGDRHRICLWLQGALGMVAQASGRDAEAEAALRATLAGCQQTLGAQHVDTTSAMANLAAFLRAQGRTDEAQELLVVARAQFELTLGRDHPTTLGVLYNLGAIAVERGQGAEAEALLAEALAGMRARLGPHHEHTLLAAGALARSLELLGRRDEAERLHREALAAAEAELGPDHVVTNARRQALAGFLFDQPGSVAEVGELFAASLASQRRIAGPTHPATLRAAANLARFHQQHQDLDRAEELLREALVGTRERLGAEHPAVLELESDLAGVLLDTSRPAEAEALARHATEAGARVLPADSPALARHRLRLGLALRNLGRVTEGRAEFAAAHAVLVASRGAADPLVVYAAGELATWDDHAPR
ncbi:MAG: serine/threonine protein kinase [Planctomycetes bacterium]|nr:serine/threonine protein kinase [Planctomycetota bacterium]